MSEVTKPRLWSDFDGTAVGLVPKWNWRNWSKYPLPLMDGYVDFLQGVQNAGVEIAGVASRRPNIAPRRAATMRSIAALGLDAYFVGAHQVVLAGSERAKAAAVIADTASAVVGVVDDKPHKFGQALTGLLLRPPTDWSRGIVERRLVLGITDGPKSKEYTEQFIDTMNDHPGILVADTAEGYVLTGIGTFARTDAFDWATRFSVDVVNIEPYSTEAGAAFADILLDRQQRAA